MRLPFGFPRRSRPDLGSGPSADEPAGQATGAGSAGESARPADGVRLPVTAAPSRAWAGLPPIQRAASDMPLVATPRAFVDRLAGTTGLPPVVQLLGHDVSAATTPGLIVARTVVPEAEVSGRLPVPPQRRPVDGAADPLGTTAGPTTVARRVADGSEQGHPPPGPTTTVAAARPTPTPRQLPTIRAADLRVPDASLVDASAHATPVAQRSPARSPGSVPASQASPPATGMRRASLTIKTPSAGSRSVADEHPPAAIASPAKVVARSATRTGEHSERPGLGAPLPGLSSTARPIGRDAGQVSVDPRNALALVQRLPAVAAASSVGAAPSPQRQAPLRLQQLPLVEASRPTSSKPAPARSTPVARPAARPIVGRTPIHPGPPLHRSDIEASTPGGAVPRPWWDASAGAPPVADGLGSTGLAALPSGLRPSPAGEAARPSATVQRSIAMGTPGVRVSKDLPLSPRGAIQGTGASRAVDGHHASSVDRPREAGMPTTGSADVPVQASHGAPSTPPTAAIPAIVGTPVIQRVEGLAPVADADEDTARSEDELEELAEALFGRIRGRLRSDLLNDREAKGLAFDHV